ncbi:diacylglycerol kinase family protein [Aequorivita sp. F47161]|uniref:Diacylglycerol kinase family protein n=1 Tax=Aequorivita vitellina TaxID=2874475 RepID=A0A9X1U390_9FLAO|nr:diacylglycerol kinase family protein [Aequorivita vitellina]MCG2419027.1 diacylglycerol kinase family protein [Aequorivita vitellina]
MWNSFLGKRLKAFRYAFKGAFLLLRHEASIQVQTAIAIVMTITGFYFEISAVEWMFQIFAIGLILSVEGLNTAVEKIADFVHPDFHNKIGFIKDIAAGAVFFAAVTAIIIGCFIYIPKF